MKEDKGKWEEVIRSKLYDFEVDTNKEDWKNLSAGLTVGKTVRLIPYRKYVLTAIAAAAAIALLIVGGLNLFSDVNDTPDMQAFEEETIPLIKDSDLDTGENGQIPTEENPVSDLPAFSRKQEKRTLIAKVDDKIDAQPSVEFKPLLDETIPDETIELSREEEIDTDEKEDERGVFPDIKPEGGVNDAYRADVAPVTKRRRWGFGMGGGGYAVSSTSGGAPVTTSSGVMHPEEDYMRITLRSSPQSASLFDPVEVFNSEVGKVKHLKPLSGGLGVSYYLTDRWTLHSGVVYTLLRSKNNEDMSGWKQNLHFIGIPLSVSYKIAEWKRINFYATAGGMGELNIAGKRNTTVMVDNLETKESENIRMKEPYWSVNTRVGVSYPLWKFIYFYGETGVSYYFDNKSNIETVRSDKPFNVSLQAGLRFGF